MAKKRLDQLRDRIDEIDDQLIDLLNQRFDCVKDVGEAKADDSGDGEVVIYRPERETQILQRLIARNHGPLSDAQLEMFFREIFSLAVEYQQPRSVSYLGPQGTYTHHAALKQFGRSAKVHSAPSIYDVFHAVASRRTNFGVVPVENSTEGAVNQTLDCFMDVDVVICAEVSLPIHHALLASSGVTMESISTIYSHEQSLAQCRNWIRERLPNAQLRPIVSNGEAARLASIEENAGAIAGEIAAEQFSLEILASHIEDQATNATRFLVLGNHKVKPSGFDKTSLLVHTPNQTGALVEVLSPFQRHDISLTRVVTRPARSGKWSYVFFIDFDGHEEDEPVASVLHEVRKIAFDLKVLGSYPRAIET